MESCDGPIDTSLVVVAANGICIKLDTLGND